MGSDSDCGHGIVAASAAVLLRLLFPIGAARQPIVYPLRHQTRLRVLSPRQPAIVRLSPSP